MNLLKEHIEIGSRDFWLALWVISTLSCLSLVIIIMSTPGNIKGQINDIELLIKDNMTHIERLEKLQRKNHPYIPEHKKYKPKEVK